MKRSSGSSQFSALRTTTCQTCTCQYEKMTRGRRRDQGGLRAGQRDGEMEVHAPKDQVGVRHEVRDALEHAARFEHKRREGDLVQIHADPVR